MNSRSFYGGSNLHHRHIRQKHVATILEGSDDDSATSSSDEEWTPQRRNEVIETSSSSDEETDCAAASLSTPTRNNEPPAASAAVLSTSKNLSWRATNSDTSTTPTYPVWVEPLPRHHQSGKTAHEYFTEFLDDSTPEYIVEQSNLSAIQRNTNQLLNITRGELQDFLSICLYMSAIRLPNTRKYWSTTCRIDQVADTMPRNRFERIKQCLHFNGNSQQPSASDDRLFKIRPLFEMIRQKFCKLPFHEEMVCVDEQIVPYKGKHSLNQYIPNKPKKYGYKMFLLCDSSGVVHNFDLYTGKISPVSGQEDIGASGNTVLQLASVVPHGGNYKLYCDNWFTSVPLFSKLAEDKIWALGTVRQSRLPGCVLKDRKELKRDGRGSFDVKVASRNGTEVYAIKWFDNRSVTFLTTYVSVHPVENLKKYDKKRKEYVRVPSPACVRTYKFMGGVDLVDQMAAASRLPLKSRK